MIRDTIERVNVGVARIGEVSAEAMAALSRRALDVPLAGADAILLIARPDTEANVVGTFQRGLRRGSGGAAASVGPGTLWMTLALANPAALGPCTPQQILNRHVRPLLRALTKSGATASYFGRDWVSVAHRPAALVAFGHDAASQRTIFEAIVAVTHPFATDERGSFRGKAPGTIEEVAKKIDLVALESAIAQAYGASHDADIEHDLVVGPSPDPPWAATVEEAIGEIGAGPDARGVFRVGGDLMASRDAIASLEARAASAPLEEVPGIVNEAFTAGSGGAVAIEGVRDLASIARVIELARLRGETRGS